MIGKDVPYTLLQSIVDIPEPELRLGLTHLQSAEFLYETTVFPDPEYTFKHALTHEVAYGGILQERRRTIHARITEAIETLYQKRLPEHLERLAHHAVRGELWEKAYNYLKQAGNRALTRSANQEAINFFEQALDAIQRLPESQVTIERAIDLRLELRSALHPLGDFNRVLETLRKAEALAQSLGDRRRHGRVLSYLAQSFRLTGDYQGAIDAGKQAVSIAQTFGDLAIQAPANFHLGQAFFHFGDHDRAIEFHLDNIRTLNGDLARDRLGMAGIPVVFSRGHLAWSLAELGRFTEGVAAWREAVQLADEVKHPFSEAFAKYCGGFLYLRKGEIERAVEQLEPGLALCKSMNVRLEIPFVGAFLGFSYSLQGRHRDGIALATQAVDEMKSLNIVSGRSWLMGILAYTHLLAGELPKAAGLAQQANDLALEYGERGWTAWTKHVVGLIRLAEGETRFDEARKGFEEAMEIARTLGLQPLLARSELSLGQMYRRAQDKERAHTHLTNAAKLLGEMEMSFWLQKAQA
ncbi:MAG: ATP-binding protein, partial [Burkholderiales bacterium]